MAGTVTDRRTGSSSAGPTTDRRIGVSGSIAVKAPCRAIALTNITLSGEQTIDGVACVADDRVVAAGQTSSINNGIYLVSTGDWSRAPDFDDNHDVVKGSIVHVTDGTSNSGLYALTTADDVEIGTDDITFANLLTLIGASSLLSANNLSDVSDAFASLRNLMENGTTVVSANPLVLTSAGGDFVDVSGNTGFSAVTLAEGKSQWVRFTGTPTITVGASLIGNNNAGNILIEAGDIVLFRGYASSVVRFVHFPVRPRASNAETATGTDVLRAVSPAGLASLIGSVLQAYDADTAKLDVADQVITGGARVTPLDLGTITTGTLTLDPGDRPLQRYINGGAHALAPGTNNGSIVLQITNNASAGAVTTSGYTKVVGAFTTTNGDDFMCTSIVNNGFSLLTIQALQ